MEDHDDGQFREMLTSREIQEVHKIVRNQLENQVGYCPILSNTISKFLTLTS